MQNEIAEARQIQQYNAQLHKDLFREQTARKRLHNEMEDLKGKIRVYVRIRPISNGEREKNCSESGNAYFYLSNAAESFSLILNCEFISFERWQNFCCRETNRRRQQPKENIRLRPSTYLY